MCLQLLCGKGADCEVLSAEPPTAVGVARELEADRGSEREKDTAKETAARERDNGILGAAPPIRVTESQTGSAKGKGMQFQGSRVFLCFPHPNYTILRKYMYIGVIHTYMHAVYGLLKSKRVASCHSPPPPHPPSILLNLSRHIS